MSCQRGLAFRSLSARGAPAGFPRRTPVPEKKLRKRWEYSGGSRVVPEGSMRIGSESETTFSQAALGHLDSIYSYAASLCDSPAQAEALVQATYRCAARAFGSLAPDGNLKSRLYAIARNIWLNQVHCGAAVVRAPDPHAFPADGTESQGVRTALERLPRPYREVIVLHEFEGLSYCEIASIVHCPAGTVFSRLDRGRKRLRRVLSACRISAPRPPIEVTP